MADLICHKHDKIIKLANQIEGYRERDFDSVKDTLDTIQSLAWDIRYLAEEAKESGISMENRLQEYHNAIEGLGFQRVR
jgi:indole-3-glycerol phosphate synthase